MIAAFLIPQQLKYFTINLSKTSYTYTGIAKKPTVTVKYGEVKLVRGEDYGVRYSNNVNAGTAKAIITDYYDSSASVTKTFTISKASNSMTVKATTSKLYKPKELKSSSKSFKAITVSNAKGTVSYTVKYANTKSKNALSFNKNTGKITVKKGTKKGTYKVTITIKDPGTKNYKSKTITKTIKVQVVDYVVM